MDELAISSVEKINKLAPRLGNSMLTDWSTMRLEQLQEQQGGMVSKTKTSYIPDSPFAYFLRSADLVGWVDARKPNNSPKTYRKLN